MSHREILDSELHEFQIDLPIVAKNALATYCDELIRWNKKINLTGLSGRDMVRRLVVEPAWIARQLKLAGVLVDIGSGNGSPAVPMHLTVGFKQCHMVEARTKRAAFLRHIAATLKLSEMTIHRGRFEDVAQEIGATDWVTLQAVSLTSELMDSIRRIASSTTNIVWITAADVPPPIPPSGSFCVPVTGTQVLIFRWDLS